MKRISTILIMVILLWPVALMMVSAVETLAESSARAEFEATQETYALTGEQVAAMTKSNLAPEATVLHLSTPVIAFGFECPDGEEYELTEEMVLVFSIDEMTAIGAYAGWAGTSYYLPGDYPKWLNKWCHKLADKLELKVKEK